MPKYLRIKATATTSPQSTTGTRLVQRGYDKCLSFPKYSSAGIAAMFGIVVDGTTGKGIGGATVEIFIHTETIRSRTTSDGGYTVDVPDGSGYVLTVRYPGYTTFTKGDIKAANNALIKISVTLYPQWASIAGSVIDGYTLKKLSNKPVSLYVETVSGVRGVGGQVKGKRVRHA